MVSLWQATGPTIRSDDFGEAGSADVVVVGAGITGLTAAVLLARSGKRVTVLEARTIGAVATGNTTGKLSLLQGTALTQIRDHAGDAVLQAYMEANREGQAWLLHELEARGLTVERRTAYTYATEVQQRGVLEHEFDAARSVGLPVRETSETELPVETAGALVLENQAQLHPIATLAVLAGELRERGGRVVERCRVRDVEETAGHVRAVSSLGTITAEYCVLATGTPVLDRSLFFAKLEPSRSFVAAYRVASGDIPPGMYVSVGSPSRSLRTATGPDGAEVLVVGGASHVTGRSPDTSAELRALDQWTVEHFGEARRVSWWAAQDYRSHSRIPYAGPMPGSQGRIFTATGYNKWGMTNAVAAALTIAADILGGHLQWALTMREHQLSLPQVRDALSANASVAGHLVSGWTSAAVRSTAAATDLAEGDGEIVRDGLAQVAVSRIGDKVCRVSGVCTHLGGVLSWNAAERSWDCPLHGSRFAADGSVLEGPAVRDLEEKPL